MRNFIGAGLAALALGCTGAALAQEAMPPMSDPAAPAPAEPAPAEPAPAIQTQANPPGEGVPTDVPPNPATASVPVAPAMPSDPAYQAGAYKGALTAPPQEAMNKVYPVCSATVQDSCINRSEAGTKRTARARRRG